ncbi:MAG TPA: hypothetical protein VGR36_06215 [Candidatus Acidoferrales bacterium]|nr:hypothetical protein [Candidatus Acidoferrales bacterium]
MAEAKLAAPKYGEHVTSSQHQGTFEVVGVNALMQTCNIRALDGNSPVIPNVAWTLLKPAGKK